MNEQPRLNTRCISLRGHAAASLRIADAGSCHVRCECDLRRCSSCLGNKGCCKAFRCCSLPPSAARGSPLAWSMAGSLSAVERRLAHSSCSRFLSVCVELLFGRAATLHRANPRRPSCNAQSPDAVRRSDLSRAFRRRRWHWSLPGELSWQNEGDRTPPVAANVAAELR